MSEPKLLPAWGTPSEPNPTPTNEAFQPPYLTNNWKMILASEDNRYHYEFKYVRVQSMPMEGGIKNVATIMNRGMMVRCEVPLPEGYYTLDPSNNFSHANTDDIREFFYQSRDVETLRPQFQHLESTPPFTREECAKFIEFLNFVRQNNNHHLVLMAHEAAYLVHKQDVWYKFPFPLPVKGDGQVFSAYYLKLVFTEMLRYDYVFIGRDNRNGYSNPMPLVIGLDWGHCALIMPKNW